VISRPDATGFSLLENCGPNLGVGGVGMVLSKVTVTLPDALREHLIEPPFFVSHHGAPPPPVADLAAIRAAIRAERKLRISHGDEKDARTERTIWPFAIAYFAEATLVNAWCELRDDFRHFRADRILGCEMLDESLPVCGKTLFARWQSRFGLEDKPNSKAPVRLTGVARN